MALSKRGFEEGRPTKYKEEYCDTIIEFFDIEHTKFVNRKKVLKDGSIVEWEEEVANQLPTFERFAVECGVHVDTLIEWTTRHEKFSEAYKRCKNMQKEMINDLGMRGFYNPTYTMFVAKNITDMKDKVDQDINVSGSGVAPVINVNGVTKNDRN